MNKSSFIQEGEGAKKAPTLVRRVSDMFKDGTYSGPPSLFSQKIRHCCQNLNLFPYLLYSFENSKSHPLAKKVNICFDLIIKNFIERLLFVYTSARHAAIKGLQSKSLLPPKKETFEPKKTVKTSETTYKIYPINKRQKLKQTPALLIAAIYLAPLVLVCQLIGLGSLLIFGKYPPGFIFLISALILLAYISMKIMFHDTIAHQRKKEERREKRKEE